MMMQRTRQTFLAALMKPTMVRPMSTAATIQARFEQAYLDRKASLAGKTGPQYVEKLT